MKLLLNHCHLIVDGNKEYLDGAIFLDGEHILDVFPHANKVTINDEYKEENLNGLIVMPGFFDTHTHGIDGVSFDTADTQELDKASLEFAQSGTTSYLASLSYDCPTADFDTRFKIYNDYQFYLLHILFHHVHICC